MVEGEGEGGGVGKGEGGRPLGVGGEEWSG
jgi:hypothetical protein